MPSANVTAAIDNMTAALTGTPAAVTSLAAALALIAAVLPLFFELALMVSLLYLAFSKQDMILHVVSGLVTTFIALLWLDDYTGVSVVLIGLGAYQLIWQALIPATVSSGPSRGLSQFKGLIRRMRGGRGE